MDHLKTEKLMKIIKTAIWGKSHQNIFFKQVPNFVMQHTTHWIFSGKSCDADALKQT